MPVNRWMTFLLRQSEYAHEGSESVRTGDRTSTSNLLGNLALHYASQSSIYESFAIIPQGADDTWNYSHKDSCADAVDVLLNHDVEGEEL